MDIHCLIEKLHQGQTRNTGEKYTSHLVAVRDILRKEGITKKYILNAALLHDSIEDSYITKHYINIHFGNKVSSIVEGLSKNNLWKTKYCKLQNHISEIENTSITRPEVILIKMADRLHNLQTLSGFSLEKQKKYIEETQKYLIPLFEQFANQKLLGDLSDSAKNLLGKIKKEIQSFSLSHNR